MLSSLTQKQCKYQTKSRNKWNSNIITICLILHKINTPYQQLSGDSKSAATSKTADTLQRVTKRMNNAEMFINPNVQQNFCVIYVKLDNNAEIWDTITY